MLVFPLLSFSFVYCGFKCHDMMQLCYEGAVKQLLFFVRLTTLLVLFSLYAVLVLQAAQVVLISLFELNTPEFTMLLGALPKTFQDGATKLLHNHLKNSSNAAATVPPTL